MTGTRNLNAQAQKGVESLTRRFVGSPRLQVKKKFSADEAAGSIELAWYRGHHSGIHDSYKKLRKKYPEAAQYLLDCFHMRKNGDMTL